MTKYKYIETGNRLKKLRGELSQKEFAKKIGISLISYKRYEYGERIPPSPVISRIAAVCHTATDWILTGVSEPLKTKLFESEIEKAILDDRLSNVKRELKKVLSQQGIPVPENISAFAETFLFFNKKGINLVDLIKGITFKEPYLMALMEKIESIYKKGTPKQKAQVRGIIEEVYDEVVSKPVEKLKEGAA